jgi:hypothetical protein
MGSDSSASSKQLPQSNHDDEISGPPGITDEESPSPGELALTPPSDNAENVDDAMPIEDDHAIGDETRGGGDVRSRSPSSESSHQVTKAIKTMIRRLDPACAAREAQKDAAAAAYAASRAGAAEAASVVAVMAAAKQCHHQQQQQAQQQGGHTIEDEHVIEDDARDQLEKEKNDLVDRWLNHRCICISTCTCSTVRQFNTAISEVEERYASAAGSLGGPKYVGLDPVYWNALCRATTEDSRREKQRAKKAAPAHQLSSSSSMPSGPCPQQTIEDEESSWSIDSDLDAVQQAEYKAQNYARNLRLKYEKEDAVDSAPGVSVVTAAAPLLPHVFPATARTAPTRQDLQRAGELGKAWVMAALDKAAASN